MLVRMLWTACFCLALGAAPPIQVGVDADDYPFEFRDDNGFWTQVEAYLGETTGTTFTDGICPDCAQRFRHGG